jgi:hypothetical protein
VRQMNRAKSTQQSTRKAIVATLIGLLLSVCFASCGGGGGGASAVPVVVSGSGDNSGSGSGSSSEQNLPEDEEQFDSLSLRTLSADGEGQVDTYDLIKNFAGPNPIEAPDLYEINHPGSPHIFEATDQDVGDHFVFVIHRDEDRDRDRLDITDRQRNEIKTYDKSEDAVKAYEDEVMIYRWKFKIESGISLTTRFSHFFQLKAVGGDDSMPIITLTGNVQSGDDGFEIRHSPLSSTTGLARTDRDKVEGRWLTTYVRATFSEEGDLRMIIVDEATQEVIFDISEQGLDMWRGTAGDHFVRPKWGIYRSLAEKEELRDEEEVVRFANFEVEKVRRQ